LRCISYSTRLFIMHHPRKPWFWHRGYVYDASVIVCACLRCITTLMQAVMHRKQHYLRLVILQFILHLVYRLYYRRSFCSYRRLFAVVLFAVIVASLQSLSSRSRENISASTVSDSSSRNLLYVSERSRDTDRILYCNLFCRSKNSSE